MAALVKLVSVDYGIPIVEVVAARALVSMVISYLDIKRKGLSVWGNNKRLLIARGIVGTFSLMCVYFAIVALPLAEATILQYLNPVFTAILALLFLKERIHSTTVVCIVFCLFGLMVLVSPNLMLGGVTSLPWFYVGIALLGAFGSAIAYIIVRKLSSSEDSSVIIFYFPLIALPISLVLLGNDFVIPTLPVLILLLFVGIFTQVGQWGLTKAMQTEVASKATAYSYVQVLFAVLLGVLLFDESPSVYTLLGGGLILAGSLVNAYGGFKNHRPKVLL